MGNKEQKHTESRDFEQILNSSRVPLPHSGSVLFRLLGVFERRVLRLCQHRYFACFHDRLRPSRFCLLVEHAPVQCDRGHDLRVLWGCYLPWSKRESCLFFPPNFGYFVFCAIHELVLAFAESKKKEKKDIFSKGLVFFRNIAINSLQSCIFFQLRSSNFTVFLFLHKKICDEQSALSLRPFERGPRLSFSR